ncbi:MAG: precorrin-8X methylmutase [Proteobacteria bacterium]|nr:precorrin-8X methylmutase [Pseudomonadota bacterium]
MKKGFLVAAHGSRRSEANDQVNSVVDKLKKYFQTDMFEPAFMELAKPSIGDGIKALADKGMEELVVYPFFLFKGMHFKKDVPEEIEAGIAALGKEIPWRMLEPIGLHPDIFDIVKDMMYDEVMASIEATKVEPGAIEDKSMELIETFLEEGDIPEDRRPVVKRVIHTTGDFDFLRNMVFHDDAVSAGMKAIGEKRAIYTDVTMIQSGINKRFGHEVSCILKDPDVIKLAEEENITKAAAGIRSLGHKLDGNIVAIGNAPTALITLVDMIKNDGVRPALVVGIPVGFVNAKESKVCLTTQNEVPYITNRGAKGGSTVAAAIVNAFIKVLFIDK